MKITIEFSKAIKIAFFVSIFLMIYSFLLSYYNMSGISTSSPEENTLMRHIVNTARQIIYLTTLWILIGYITKDLRSAVISLVLNLFIVVSLKLFHTNDYSTLANRDSVLTLILNHLYILSYFTFSILHFKNSKAIKIILFYLISAYYVVAMNYMPLDKVFDGFANLIGYRDVFKIHIPREAGYSELSIFQLITNQVTLIIDLSVFWWVYQLIKSNQSVWSRLHTIQPSTYNDRFAFSIIYWAFRIALFTMGLGLLYSLNYQYFVDSKLMQIERIMYATFSMIIIAMIYRNFLVSTFAQQDKYPSGSYFLLNFPILNFFAWITTLLQFDDAENKLIRSDGWYHFNNLQKQFRNQSRNGGWKVLIIIFGIVAILFNLNGIVNGRSTQIIHIIYLILPLLLMIFYLYNKEAYIPVIALQCITVLAIILIGDKSTQNIAIGSSLVNIIVYYGMFYFDEFELAEHVPPEKKLLENESVKNSVNLS